MINSFLNKTKISENIQKKSSNNYITNRERKYNNGNNDSHILCNIRQKKNYNNHRFYSNNEKENNKNNLTEINRNLNHLYIYKSNSKPKKEENNNMRLSFKTKNHNYHNINNTYHSYDKNKKSYGRNTFDNNQVNNIKLLETEVYTPRNNNKSKCFEIKKNINDLSKTLKNFKYRDNYGYHEINEVKKNNINQNNNNTDKKKSINTNMPNYLSININNYNSFRPSLNNDNRVIKTNPNIQKKNNVNYNNQNKEKNNNQKELNNNINIRKNSYLNFKKTQNYFNPSKNLIKEENNYSSYKNIKETKNNQSKENYTTTDDKENLNKSLLIRKIYTKKIPEDKKNKNEQISVANYIKRNDIKNNNINKENIKNNNSNRFLSGDLRDAVKDEKSEIENNKNNTIEKLKFKNYKIPISKINKLYSPIKTDNSKAINHIKQNSYSNYNTNSTEKKFTKGNDKYKINHIFKKIEKNSIIDRKFKVENKNNAERIPNIQRINEKINLKDNNNNSFILTKNTSLRRITNNTNNQKDLINNIKPKDSLNTKNLVNSNIKAKSKYNNPFNKNENKKRKDLTDKNKYKEIIKKKCKSIEKNNNLKEKNQKINKAVEEVKKHRTRTKTKSKAKKHSKKVKYLDKLKIFKYSETYNLCYESSTNCTKDFADYKYKKYIFKSTKSHSKKKKDINCFNLNYKTFEEDFKINENSIKYKNLKPQISVRITLTKKNNVNIAGILRYFKVNYFCSENLRNKYDIDSEDTSEYYNSKF